MKLLDSGEVIRNERKQKGMTQEQLASILNVDKRSVSKVERGEYSSTLETIRKYSEPLGKEPVIYLTDIIEDKDYPIGRSYTSYIIENIIPIERLETVEPHVRNNSEDLRESANSLLDQPFTLRKARDIAALIDFWNLILASEALDTPCCGIQLTIRTEEKTQEQATIESFLDNVLSRLFIEEITKDDIFGAEIGCSHVVLVDNYWIEQESGPVSIIFYDSIQNDKRIKTIVKRLVDREKEKLRKAESYFARNPDGFHFMCYDLPFEYDDVNDEMDSFEIVKAWTPEEAKKKYLEINQEDRLYQFYDEDFVNDFAEMTIYGETFENLVNAKKINEIADALYEKIECRTEDRFLEEDDFCKIKEKIISNYSKEELFNAFGIDDFKAYWLERAIIDVGAQIPKSEADMMEYVYSVLIYRNRTPEEE